MNMEKERTALTDLPPELLDHIISYLPTAQSVSNISKTSQHLRTFIEKDAWQTFVRTRFPSLHPLHPSSSSKDVARSLTTLSRAWDRRSFVARYIEPFGDVRAFPGNKKVERWKRPRGQTIGFTPQLDCFEEIRSSWRERREVLAFSAGAEVCVRQRWSGMYGSDGNGGQDGFRWVTYRPLSAVEGRDDITTLHLMRPREGEGEEEALRLVAGTANGDLQMLELPKDRNDAEVPKINFTTQGLPVRSSSLLQESWKPPLLAASLDDTRICIYPVDPSRPSIEPSNQIELRRPSNGHRTYRAWSTNFLSSSHLAVGLGPSEEPVHIHALTPAGLTKDPVRKYNLQNDIDKLAGEITLSGFAKKTTSSVYPIVPLPPSSSSAAGHDAQVFLSGAYDGIIRLHDLRSSREVEQAYIDPTDESAIYSLLPRGQEKLVAGTSRHTLLKVFDLRLGAKAYSYLNASPSHHSNGDTVSSMRATQAREKDWNLFLKPHTATYSGRGGGNNWARRSAESSIYSLASPSPCSPYVYAGVENAVVEMAFTGMLDPTPDPVFFGREVVREGRKGGVVRGFRDKEILDLAMYEQDEGLKLMGQRSAWETTRVKKMQDGIGKRGGDGDGETVGFLGGLDERWRVGGS